MSVLTIRKQYRYSGCLDGQSAEIWRAMRVPVNGDPRLLGIDLGGTTITWVELGDRRVIARGATATPDSRNAIVATLASVAAEKAGPPP
jgi:hypothetical protein